MISRHHDRGWQKFGWPRRSTRSSLWPRIGVPLICIIMSCIMVAAIRFALIRQDEINSRAAAQMQRIINH